MRSIRSSTIGATLGLAFTVMRLSHRAQGVAKFTAGLAYWALLKYFLMAMISFADMSTRFSHYSRLGGMPTNDQTYHIFGMCAGDCFNTTMTTCRLSSVWFDAARVYHALRACASTSIVDMMLTVGVTPYRAAV